MRLFFSVKVILEELYLDIECNYALEVDRDAKAVSRINHLSSVIQLGDIRQFEEEDVIKLGEINFLAVTLPCTELSQVNYRRKGLDGDEFFLVKL